MGYINGFETKEFYVKHKNHTEYLFYFLNDKRFNYFSLTDHDEDSDNFIIEGEFMNYEKYSENKFNKLVTMLNNKIK